MYPYLFKGPIKRKGFILSLVHKMYAAVFSIKQCLCLRRCLKGYTIISCIEKAYGLSIAVMHTQASYKFPFSPSPSLCIKLFKRQLLIQNTLISRYVCL